MSHNSQVTDLKAIRCRKTCNLCHFTHWKKASWSLHSSHNCSPFSNASHNYSRQRPRWKVMDEGMTNEGPCVHCSVVLLPLHPFVLFPAFLCVICIGPLVCVANAWTGPGRSQVTASHEPHPSSLPLTTIAAVPQWWHSTCSDGWQLLLALKRKCRERRKWRQIPLLYLSLREEIFCAACGRPC